MTTGADAHSMYARKEADSDTLVRVGVGLIIRNAEGAILLERRSDNGFWGLPGGRIEPGESILQTAIREAEEETGLRVSVTRLLGVYSDPEDHIITFPDNVVHVVDIVLDAAILSGKLTCSSESLELRFFLAQDLPAEAEIVPPARAPLYDFIDGAMGVAR